MGFVFFDDTGIRTDGDFTVGKCKECIDGFVGRDPGWQVYKDLHVGSRIVVNFADFDLPLFIGFQDGLDDGGSGFSVRNFLDDQSFAVSLFNLCPYFDNSAPQSVVVFRHVDRSAGGKVGV